MAAGVSGSFTIAGSKAGITCRVQYSETYDVASNASSVKVRVQFKANSNGWYGFTYYLTGSVSAAGSTLVSCSSTNGRDKVRWEALDTYAYMQAGTNAATSWTKSGIAHNADGSKSITISVNLTGYTTDGQHGNGWNVSGSKSIALTTIPRASEIGATDANVGAVSMVAVTRKSTAYTHSVAYAFGTLSGFLTAAGGTSETEVRFADASVAFAVPDSFYAQIPNAKSGVCTLTCRTYSGSTQIGAATGCSFTVTAAESLCAPTVSGAVADANPATKALTGDQNVLVRYFSTAQCTITAAAKNGAGISARSIAGEAVSGTGRTIPNVETGSFLFSVTDSRGYTAAATVTKQLLDYVRLTCDGSVSRPAPTADTAVLNLSGNYFNASFGAADNTLAVSYKVGGGSAVTLVPTKSGNGWSAKATLSGVAYTNSYAVTVTAADRLMTVTKSLTLNRGVPVFDWGAGSFRINVPAVLAGGLDAASRKMLLDMVYPVGSYYWSSSAASPASLFGGAWEQVKDRFVLAAGDTYPVNASGGEASHVLSVQELPSHSHTQATVGLTTAGYSGDKYGGYYNRDYTGHGSVTSTTQNAGGGGAHNNMPPYIAAYCWRRTA